MNTLHSFLFSTTFFGHTDHHQGEKYRYGRKILKYQGSRDSVVDVRVKPWVGQPKNSDWIPSGKKGLSLLQNFQSGSGEHPAPCLMGTEKSFPWA
jgi:hypothetical protein